MIVKTSPRWCGYLHAVVGLDLLVDPGEHLLHALLVGLDVLHLALQTVLHLVLHQVDPDPRLPVLHTLVVYSANKQSFLYFCKQTQLAKFTRQHFPLSTSPQRPLGLGDCVLQLGLGFFE